MPSSIVLITAIESGLGFLLTGTALYLVLSRGRKPYHYLFAAFLLICVIWDLGTFLMMIRNGHPKELELIGRIAIPPCVLIPALMFHFSNLYTGRPVKWAVVLVWVLTTVLLLLTFAGVIYKIEGVYTYPWGSIFRVAPSFLDPGIVIFWFGINLPACWLLFRSLRRITSALERRHYIYIISGFLAVTLAIVKAFVTMGVDASFLLPLGMFLNDVFVTIIGLAIIKDRLLDITVIIKRGAIYSALAALLIFIYSFSEHLLITYFGNLMGGHSGVAHLISIAVGIVVLMPVKQRLEHGAEKYFAQKKLEF